MATAKIIASHKGRRCKFPGCKRMLSIYNHEVHCHVHLGKLARDSWRSGFDAKSLST